MVRIPCFEGYRSDLSYALSLKFLPLKEKCLLAVNENDSAFFDYLQQKIEQSLLLKMMDVREKKDCYQVVLASQAVANGNGSAF